MRVGGLGDEWIFVHFVHFVGWYKFGTIREEVTATRFRQPGVLSLEATDTHLYSQTITGNMLRMFLSAAAQRNTSQEAL